MAVPVCVGVFLRYLKTLLHQNFSVNFIPFASNILSQEYNRTLESWSLGDTSTGQGSHYYMALYGGPAVPRSPLLGPL